jgi:hypothetical protein
MAADLRKQGFVGITTNSTYDAWTPSRAYSHYHGGVRILSETASCKLATPITVKFDQLRPGQGYDPRKEAPNFRPVWQGGEWHIGDITRYMTTAAFSLLNNAADNREKWLTRFYEIGNEAVRPRKDGEIYGYRIPLGDNAPQLIDIFERAGVQFIYPAGEKPTSSKDLSYFETETTYPANSIIVPLAQPYGAFAKSLLEIRSYPNLLNENGVPIPPYDVTSHTESLMLNLKPREVRAPFRLTPVKNPRILRTISDCQLGVNDKVGLYRAYVPSMDEGWSRWVIEKMGLCREFERLTNLDLNQGKLEQRNPPRGKNVKYKVVIFPDQSPNQILNGYAKGTMPDEYVGGVGKEGVENLKKFVEAGGTLVFLNRSSDFAIEQFGLPIRDVTKGLARKDFYIPGSILRTELDTTNPIAKGMPAESIAWFESGPAFEAVGPPAASRPVSTTPSAETASTPLIQEGSFGNVRVIARYPSDPSKILLSGWALGAEKIAGKAALVEVTYGKGKIILFGFRPQYRGQSLATFPLFFNAISQ